MARTLEFLAATSPPVQGVVGLTPKPLSRSLPTATPGLSRPLPRPMLPPSTPRTVPSAQVALPGPLETPRPLALASKSPSLPPLPRSALTIVQTSPYRLTVPANLITAFPHLPAGQTPLTAPTIYLQAMPEATTPAAALDKVPQGLLPAIPASAVANPTRTVLADGGPVCGEWLVVWHVGS